MKRSLVDTVRLKDSKCSNQFTNYIVNNANLKGKQYQLWHLIRGLALRSGFCWMSQEHMGDIVEVKRWWVGKLINQLAEMGLIYSTGKDVSGTLKIRLCVPRSLMKRYKRSLALAQVRKSVITSEEANKQYRLGKLYLKRKYTKKQGEKIPIGQGLGVNPYPAVRIP